MTLLSPCPSSEVFRRLLEGGGTAEDVETLAGHLELCKACGEVLEGLLAANPIYSLSQSAEMRTLLGGASLASLQQRLRQLRPAVQAAGNPDETVAARPKETLSSAGPPDEPTESGLDFLAPAQQTDELGRLGIYRILQKLGVGGMGMVFLAEDTLLHRKVALKTMLPRIAANAQARERFLREARAAAAIEHEHIVAIYQVGEDNGVPFLAMPLLKGEPLDARLKRQGVLPVAEALRIAAGDGRGTGRRPRRRADPPRHQAGERLAGRSSRARVKLLDFGLARSQSDDSQLTQIGRHRRHARLHGCRAGQRRESGRPRRPVQPGLRPLPDADGRASF